MERSLGGKEGGKHGKLPNRSGTELISLAQNPEKKPPNSQPPLFQFLSLQSPPPAMGHVEIDWEEVFRESYPGCEVGISYGFLSSAPHAAVRRSGPAAAKRAGARAGNEGVALVSSGDQEPRGAQAVHLRLERRMGELRPAERSPVTRAAAKAAAEGEQDAHSAADNVHILNQEHEQGEHVACQSCLKPSPVSVRGKKNHEQADGDCKCKRVAGPSMKNDNKEPAPPEEIFEVIREIPSLDQADLLRAYSMLIRDDRLFRSLMALPKNMRKDWLLMETGNQ